MAHNDLPLISKVDVLLKHFQNHTDLIAFNEIIFEILEGNLLEQVEKSIREQLSADSVKTALERVAPINVYKKIVSKLSKLYADEPVRMTKNPADQDLVDFYTFENDLNSHMNDWNEGYNSYKISAMEMFLDSDDRALKNRVLPSQQFLPFSDDPVNPLRMTVFLKLMGKMEKVDRKRRKSRMVDRIWAYSANEFVAFDSDGDIIEQDMIASEGRNDFGVIPFALSSRSRFLLVPMADRDTVKMTVLFPVLLTDLNFAAKFLAHSIFFGIDIDAENLKLSPDAIWLFKSDSGDGKKPSIGTIKPEVSISEVIMLIKEQLAIWLDTKNIKAGSLGKMDGNNFSSGISKIIDEADVTKDLKIQEKTFKAAENDFWFKQSTIHNKLSQAGLIDNRKKFADPDKLKVDILYADFGPLENRTDKIKRLNMEVNAGFNSKFRSIKELNPGLEDGQVFELMEEIENENSIVITQQGEPSGRTSKSSASGGSKGTSGKASPGSGKSASKKRTGSSSKG